MQTYHNIVDYILLYHFIHPHTSSPLQPFLSSLFLFLSLFLSFCFLNSSLRQQLVLFSSSTDQEETEIKKLAQNYTARSVKARKHTHTHMYSFIITNLDSRFLSQNIKFTPSCICFDMLLKD